MHIVKLLLDSGAQIDQKNDGGNALQIALSATPINKKIVKMLVQELKAIDESDAVQIRMSGMEVIDKRLKTTASHKLEKLELSEIKQILSAG